MCGENELRITNYELRITIRIFVNDFRHQAGAASIEEFIKIS